MPRAEIARTLGKRYQHVRNVLEADEAKRLHEAAQRPKDRVDSSSLEQESTIIQMVLREDGSIVLPDWLRTSFGFTEGRPVFAREDDGTLILLSRQAAVREVQAWARRVIPSDGSVVDDFIAERRAEAARGE